MEALVKEFTSPMLFDLIRNLSKQVIDWWRHKVGLKLQPLLTTIRLGGLALAAIALWLFTYIAEEVFEHETQAFDANVLLSIRGLQRSWLDPIMIFTTNIGDPRVLLVVCVVLSVILVLRHHRAEAMTIAIAGFGALGLNFVLKNLFARTRPELWSRIVDVTNYSFPSGHAMLSMVIYGLLGYLFATRFHRWRGAIATISTLLILLIGFSRLYLGVHWLTDVMAGYAAGLVWLVTCIFSLEIWRQRHDLTSVRQKRLAMVVNPGELPKSPKIGEL